jgi:hypothetical protein
VVSGWLVLVNGSEAFTGMDEAFTGMDGNPTFYRVKTFDSLELALNCPFLVLCSYDNRRSLRPISETLITLFLHMQSSVKAFIPLS